MPNYCSQTLVISGEKDDLAPFVNKLLASWPEGEDDQPGGQYELLRTFYPIPDDFDHGPLGITDLVKDLIGMRSGNPWTTGLVERIADVMMDRCSWAMKNWGSKWGDCYMKIDECDDIHIKISFKSASSNILPGIVHISKDYPHLIFSLDFQYEMCNYPDGGAKIQGGEIFSQWRESEEEYRSKLEAFLD